MLLESGQASQTSENRQSFKSWTDGWLGSYRCITLEECRKCRPRAISRAIFWPRIRHRSSGRHRLLDRSPDCSRVSQSHTKKTRKPFGPVLSSFARHVYITSAHCTLERHYKTYKRPLLDPEMLSIMKALPFQKATSGGSKYGPLGLMK